jgi:30S ribosomal protein S31
MGKGDRKTRKGKIFKGSYGRLRPKKTTSGTGTVVEKKQKEKIEAVAKEAEKKMAKKKNTKPKKSQNDI